MKKVKVKITQIPKAKYGLSSFLGYNPNYYQDGTTGNFNSTKQSLSSVPREEANLEAEGGETAYGDINFDGIPEHYNIKGPKHSQGGVPLNLPEGSFIFSDTKDMKIKNPDILKKFELGGKKGYTPAQIAKKYNINKYREILQDPNSDKTSRETAELMIKNYNEKLGALALVQESMKGFPQGVPETAMSYLETNEIDPNLFNPQEQVYPTTPELMYGGLLKFPDGGPVVKGKTGNVTAQKVDQLPGKGTKTKTESGQDAEIVYTSGAERTYKGGKAIKGSGKKPSPNWLPSLCNRLMKGATISQLVKEGHGSTSELSKLLADCVQKAEEKFTEKEEAYYVDPQTQEVVEGQPQETKEPETKTQQTIQPTEPEYQPAYETYDTPWWTPDVVNYLGAIGDMYKTKKYTPWAPRFEPEIPDVAYLDPTRELAQQSEQANIVTQGLSQFAGPQTLSSRASSIQGTGAEQAANTLSRYNNANVQIGNAFEGQKANILNNAAQVNQQLQDGLYDQYTTLNQQFDNTQAAKRENIRKYFGAGFKNASETAALNAMYPQYNTDPITGTVVFDESKKKDFKPTIPGDDFEKLVLKYQARGFDGEAAIKAAKTQLGLSDQDITPTKEYGGYTYGDFTFPFI